MKDKKPYKSREGKRSVVLLSGGLDSATALVYERLNGAEVFCLSAKYGQKNSLELVYAKRLAAKYGAASHRIIELDLSLLGRSPLTGVGQIPCRTLEEIRQDPSPAYVPARNTILLSMGLGLAESVGASEIHMGMCRDDAGFPDCTPEFVIAWQGIGTCAGRYPVTIQAPFVTWPKNLVVQLAVGMFGMDIEDTLSCYQPVKGLHCGRCDACITRRDACATAAENMGTGWTDPTEYVADL